MSSISLKPGEFKRRREALRLSQMKLAAALGVNVATIHRAEKADNVSLALLGALERFERENGLARLVGRPRSAYVTGKIRTPNVIVIGSPSEAGPDNNRLLVSAPMEEGAEWYEKRITGFHKGNPTVMPYYYRFRREADGSARFLGIANEIFGPLRPWTEADRDTDPHGFNGSRVPTTEELEAGRSDTEIWDMLKVQE